MYIYSVSAKLNNVIITRYSARPRTRCLSCRLTNILYDINNISPRCNIIKEPTAPWSTTKYKKTKRNEMRVACASWKRYAWLGGSIFTFFKNIYRTKIMIVSLDFSIFGTSANNRYLETRINRKVFVHDVYLYSPVAFRRANWNVLLLYCVFVHSFPFFRGVRCRGTFRKNDTRPTLLHPVCVLDNWNRNRWLRTIQVAINTFVGNFLDFFP